MKWLLACLFVVGGAALLARQHAGQGGAVETLLPWGSDAPTGMDEAQSADYFAEPDQTNDLFDDAVVALNPMNLIPTTVPADIAQRNIAAFLTMIASPGAEGTDQAGGYRCLFGSTPSNPKTFDSFADHPRIYTPFTINGVTQKSSAAGRYQFLARTWDALAKRLGLPDFGPDSQDAAAIELIREKGALDDVRAGRAAQAIAKCSKVWASLPGAGYGQPEASLQTLLAAYDYAGGVRGA